MKFEIYDEMFHNIEGVRLQCIKWKGTIWNIFCNDRFKPKDFKVKVHCEICGPKKFVPKVIDYKGRRFCNGCLTRMSEMLQAATLDDCRRDREGTQMLEQAYKMIERKNK